MIVHALVPVSRFGTIYEVAQGRPYSDFEYLVLKAIGQGVSNLQDLYSEFVIHRRLLLEALVTLTHAGWLLVGPGKGRDFVLSPEGEEAVRNPTKPKSRRTKERKLTVVMERVSGGLAPNSEVELVKKRYLKEAFYRCLRLPEIVTDNRLDQGQIRPLLRTSQDEWLGPIGPIWLMTRGDEDWVAAIVDTETGVIEGLGRWTERLKYEVLDRALEFASQPREMDEEDIRHVFPVPNKAWTQAPEDKQDKFLLRERFPSALQSDDLLFSFSEHLDYFGEALSSVRTSLFICSATISTSFLDGIKDKLLEALRRGCSVALLWGNVDRKEEAKACDSKLNFLTKEARRHNGKGAFHFNPEPCRVRANFVLFDSSDGAFECCLGSVPWLSLVPSLEGENSTTPPAAPWGISVRLTGDGEVASLCGSAAAFWSEVMPLSPVSDIWSSASSRLDRRFATEFAPRSDSSKYNCYVRLLREYDTKSFLRECLETAQVRLLIASPRDSIGPAAQLLPTSGQCFSLAEGCHILLGQPNLSDTEFEELKASVSSSGVNLNRIPGNQASAIVCDDIACIGSHAFLSQGSRVDSFGSREVGIVLEGTRFSERIWNEFFPGQVPSAQATSEQRRINVPELGSTVARAYHRPETTVSVERPISPWYSAEEILVVYIRDDEGWRFGVAKSCKDRAVLEAEQNGWDCMKDSKIWPLELLPREHKLLQEPNLISDGSDGPVVLTSFADEKTTHLDTLSEIIAKPNLWERCESCLEAICNTYRRVTQIAYTENLFEEEKCMMPGFWHMRNMVHPDLLKKLLEEFDWKEYTEYDVDPLARFRIVAGRLCPNSLFALANESIWQRRNLIMPYIPIHGDLNPGNLLFRRTDFSFVLIDFEKTRVGPPQYDLAFLFMWLVQLLRLNTMPKTTREESRSLSDLAAKLALLFGEEGTMPRALGPRNDCLIPTITKLFLGMRDIVDPESLYTDFQRYGARLAAAMAALVRAFYEFRESKRLQNADELDRKRHFLSGRFFYDLSCSMLDDDYLIQTDRLDDTDEKWG